MINLYRVSVFTVGLTLVCALSYGLSFKETVSNNMLTYTPYRVVISACIIIQSGFWVLCMYSKTNTDTVVWGLGCLCITIISWVGLSTVLSGTPHVVFVCIFVLSFLIDMLVLCTLTWQRTAVRVLIFSIAFQLICIIAMMVLFNNREFYIMEHVAFMSHSLIFTAFFMVHPPSEWGEEDTSNYPTYKILI